MSEKWQALIAAAACWLGALQTAHAQDHPRSFVSADGAANALVAALREHKVADWHAILGPGADNIIDHAVDDADQRQIRDFLTLYDEKHAIEYMEGDRAELEVGQDN